MKQGAYHLIAIAVVSVWGLTFVSTKILLGNGFSAQDIFFYRFLLAYISIWAISPLQVFADCLKDELRMLAAGVTGGSLFFLLQNLALEMTQASNVSFIICVSPLLTTILTVFCVRSEKMTKSFVLGTILSLLGVTLVIFNGSVILQLSPWGDFLTLGASMLWAVYSLLIRTLAKSYSSTFITRKVFFYGLLTVIPMFVSKPLFADVSLLMSPLVLGNLLFLGIVASFGCYLLWNVALDRLDTIQASNYLYLNPIATMMGAYLVLGENITLVALLGVSFVLSGIYTATREL